MIHPQVLANVDRHAAAFAAAAPFPHVVIDDFLAPACAESLLADFPPFERGMSIGDDGLRGGKATVESIRSLSPAYAALDAAIRSPAFLEVIGRLTGVAQLLYDPFYLGGGTHENRHGQSLDPHVDFNYHPSERWHRRLNLIVYLNPAWDPAWGGTLELYEDPARDARPERVVAPAFNRCVIFETSERSWHGFSRIHLPPAERARSRRSVALYFYTADRPAAQIAGRHSTVYVKRPLPERYAAGATLSQADVALLAGLLAERDAHIRLQYDEIARLLQAQDRGLAGKLLYLARRAYVRMRR